MDNDLTSNYVNPLKNLCKINLVIEHLDLTAALKKLFRLNKNNIGLLQ